MNHAVSACRALVLSALLVAGLAACGSGSNEGPTPTVTSITVEPTELRVAVGAVRELNANVTVAGNADDSVTWSTHDAAVATVNGAGTVTGVAVGVTSITATSNHDPTKSASAQVTVTATEPDPDPGPDPDPDPDPEPEPDPNPDPEPDPEPGPLDWVITFGTEVSDAGTAVAVDSQGFVIVVGYTGAICMERTSVVTTRSCASSTRMATRSGPISSAPAPGTKPRR